LPKYGTTEGFWIPSEWESGVRGLLEADFQVEHVQDDGELVNWVIIVNRWPRDVELRRGLLYGVTVGGHSCPGGV